MCETIEFRDFIAGINEFKDLLGITKLISELTDALCGRSYIIIIWFAAYREDLYSVTVVVRDSNSVPGCALRSKEYIHISEEQVKYILAPHSTVCLSTDK